MKRLFLKKILYAAVLFLLLSLSVYAEKLGDGLTVSLSDGGSVQKIVDDRISTYISLEGGEKVTLSCEKEICGFYILWNKIPGNWSYTADGKEYCGGEKGFLHEYIELLSACREIVISVPEDGAEITDVYAFSAGELPDYNTSNTFASFRTKAIKSLSSALTVCMPLV